MKEVDTRRLSLEQLNYHVRMANQEADLAGDDPGSVVTAFDRAQLVYGVWTDVTQPRGVGLAILQGIKLIEAALERGGSAGLRTAHIRCRSRDEAKVCAIMWGDDRHLQHLFDEAEA